MGTKMHDFQQGKLDEVKLKVEDLSKLRKKHKDVRTPSALKRKQKHGQMTKKQLKEFFGHKFTDFAPRSYAELSHEGTKYTLLGDKNDGLCDITPKDDYSVELLNNCRGQQITLVKED